MKLSKANEDTLKGLAKFLKDFPMTDVTMSNKPAGPTREAMLKQAKALEKDLRQLRANLKEMPEPVSSTPLCEDEGCPQSNTPHVCVNDVQPSKPEFEQTPALFVNPKQIEAQSALLGVRYDGPDENRSVPLYRKKT